MLSDSQVDIRNDVHFYSKSNSQYIDLHSWDKHNSHILNNT